MHIDLIAPLVLRAQKLEEVYKLTFDTVVVFMAKLCYAETKRSD